jgi:DNA-binding PadR family transcriptional regulator
MDWNGKPGRGRRRENGIMKLTLETLRIMVPFLASTAAVLSGYDIMRIAKLSDGTCYGILHRLASNGMLDVKTERSNPVYGLPARRLYQLTPAGHQQAKAVLDLLKVST